MVLHTKNWDSKLHSSWRYGA